MNPGEQIWFGTPGRGTFWGILAALFVALLPIILLLLDYIFKPKFTFYHTSLKTLGLTDRSYLAAIIFLFLFFIYAVWRNSLCFIGIEFLPEDKINLIHQYPRSPTRIDYGEILRYDIKPHGASSKKEKFIGYLVIHLKNSKTIKSRALRLSDEESLDKALRVLGKATGKIEYYEQK